jgi:DNA-binding FrmR family transcriptional regulator
MASNGERIMATESKEIQNLLNKKKIIDQAKADKNRLEGQLQMIKKQMEEKFDCKNANQIKAKLKSIGSQIEKNERILIEGIEELDLIEELNG